MYCSIFFSISVSYICLYKFPQILSVPANLVSHKLSAMQNFRHENEYLKILSQNFNQNEAAAFLIWIFQIFEMEWESNPGSFSQDSTIRTL